LTLLSISVATNYDFKLKVLTYLEIKYFD